MSLEISGTCPKCLSQNVRIRSKHGDMTAECKDCGFKQFQSVLRMGCGCGDATHGCMAIAADKNKQ